MDYKLKRHTSPSPVRIMIALPVLLLGGTEIQVLSVVRSLRDEGYHLTVCCYYEFDSAVLAQFESTGSEVVVLHIQRSDGLLALLFRLRRFFREVQPDIVHVQYLAPGLIPLIAARLAGIKTVFATVHIAGNYAYGTKAKFLLRLASRLCTAFFCVSRGVETFWFGSSALLDAASVQERRRHFTIYNAVDVAGIEKASRLSDTDALRKFLELRRGPVLGIVGRLAEQKGHAVLLQAMPEVLKTFPEAVLLIIGDGPERESLEEKSNSYGLADHVVWLGSKTQEEVFRLYGIIDIFVMPSLYEGFGLTAAEAMAAGLPVVASDVEGLREVVDDKETGYLCRPGDSMELAGRLKELLADADQAKAMGGRGRERAKALFSLERFRESMLLAYDELSRRR